MNILLGLNNFYTGGAENFVFRLAKAFYEKGHKVYLFGLYDWDLENAKKRIERILGKEYSETSIITRWKPGKFADFFLWRLNGIFLRLGKKDFRIKKIDKIQVRKLKAFFRDDKIDIVNTHLWETDEFFAKHFNLPHVISMHGPYESYLFRQLQNKPFGKVIDNEFLSRAEYVINKSKHIAYVADRNMEILKYINSRDIVVHKIYLGYEKRQIDNTVVQPAKDNFIFGMMARGDERKGWSHLIESFILLKKKYDTVNLLLAYTGTSYMLELKKKYEGHRDIKFLGFVDDPNEFFSLIDAFVFPTKDDCLPLSIIESLSYGIPVISTDVGEIPNMIKYQGESAGIIIPKGEDADSEITDGITNAMEEYLIHPDLYHLHKAGTNIVSGMFSMDRCVEHYIDLYQQTISDFKICNSH